MESVKIRQKVDLRVYFQLRVIVNDYNFKKILVVNIGFDLHYIVES